MPHSFATFRNLPASFHHDYFTWHTTGQYQGTREFHQCEDVLKYPPPREREDWYLEELAIIDCHYHSLRASRVLEIGCGDGNFTWKIASRCQSLLALDVDDRAIELAKSRLHHLGMGDLAEFRTVDGIELDKSSWGRFDVVFFIQVLEHVPAANQGRFFDAVFNLVAPGGCLYVSTPNRWNIRDAHDTGKLFIHWLPRRMRIPLAHRLGWGIASHDPSWSEPPVLHDYVSFRWMLRRARRMDIRVQASRMLFYPSMREWLRARKQRPAPWWKIGLFHCLRWVGEIIPLNYYFGEKVIFKKSGGV